ncbi:hypothetical protein CHLNCDRAFT_142374 [Chlorella variabilis]|uniref:Peptidase S54 rhomboid domain-containing protein n=1 Tax=Chlorella variabilis TaxID=554065 RepID=E1Z8E6_CHLVA|nr:hypothetical protein CHLNCDRAFT_142374 [Chlorella variabilis]EFN58079.1 hypothetical protein CHLNCDRAFT_142374 [Chlorella variabilis]|eukprot:XP_005850181.1 hypothetical protein CHLNCDRAFT_142374 [Chlorella variabilis]
MQGQGCHPDVVTYTALISAFEKGGQWRLALEAYERMRAQGCRADAIVYNAIIDALWETGVVWVQRRALKLFRVAVEEGHFHQGKLVPGLARAEVNLHAMTAGVAMLSLYAWLVSLRALLASHGPAAMPARLGVVTDRGKGAKEQGNLVVKEAVQAAMALWGAPFRPVVDGGYSGMLEAAGPDACDWLLGEGFEARLFTFFPCTDITPAVANTMKDRDSVHSVSAMLDDPDCAKEASVEQRCSEAFAAVQHFEKTHCLALQNMGYTYLQRRNELVAKCLEVAARLGVREEAGHDGVLLMDRVMSTSLQLAPDLLDLLAVGCVVIAARQVDGAGAGLPPLPADADVGAASGLPRAAVEQMEWNVRQVLSQDTAAISTLRCLKLFLERMGAHHMDARSGAAMAGRAQQLVTDCLTDMAFLNCRPSVIAAALLYVERRSRGIIPFWPSMLAKLTGYQALAQPATSALALLLTVAYALIQWRHLGYPDVGLSYDRVVVHRELWRTAASQLAHIDLVHLAFNLSALWSIGLVERTLGTLHYLQHTALLFLLSPAICILIYHLLIVVGQREQYREVTAVGYSCVLFGWMSLMATSKPGGITMLPVFGLASIPLWATPWASLLITSLLIPRASFVGHLAGMLAGYAVALGAFSWLNPWWSLSLLAWAAMGLSYAAARSRQLVILYIRLPGGAAFGLGGSPGGGGGGGDAESGGVGAKAGAKAGVTRIVGGEIVRT